MPPSTNSHTPLSSHLTGRSAARALARLLSVCVVHIRTLAAYLRADADPDRPERPHVATLGALGALGWHVTEIRPSNDAPASASGVSTHREGNSGSPSKTEKLARHRRTPPMHVEVPERRLEYIHCFFVGLEPVLRSGRNQGSCRKKFQAAIESAD